MQMTDRPIPGQSLTTPPRNFPYERPPDHVNPIDALEVHLDNIEESKGIEDVVHLTETVGVDLVTIVEGILRSAVMQGIHGIDVSMLIAPHVHEYIKGQLDFVGAEYDEGFEDNDMDNKIRMNRMGERIALKLEREKLENIPEGMTTVPDTESKPSEPPVEQSSKEQAMGLMSRPIEEEME
tara:strand:- start:81 stop:623 length:543 start_codon:yes stop_codon:yes gene_type:complete